MRRERYILRANVFLVSGIVVLLVLIAIEARRSWLWKRFALVYNKNAIACEMPLDLSEPTTKEAVFAPPITGKFTLRLSLHTSIPDGFERHEQLVPPNEIEDSLKKETFRISWTLQNEGQNVADGVITHADPNTTRITVEISYSFGEANIYLKRGQKYRLLVEVEETSQALTRFSPTMTVRTGAFWMKGYRLAGWKTRDTILMLILGLGLIVTGFAKQHFERR